MREGVVPSTWRRSIVTPIPKTNKPTSIVDYRPICITPAMSKVMEKMVKVKLDKFLERNSIIPDNQYGFVRNRSCELQLQRSQYIIDDATDKNENVDIIFLDLMKAFDSVSHPKLIHKLQHLGIRGKLLEWFKSFLEDRTFTVSVENHYSDWRKAFSGVPQGSVLGPTLFNIYIADLTICVNNRYVEMYCFADDIKLYYRYKTYENYMQVALTNIEDYCKVWQLEISKPKSFALQVGKNQKQAYVFNNGTLLECKTHVRDLGIYYGVNNQSKITFDYKRISNKSLAVLFNMLRCIPHADLATMKRLFRIYVKPHLEYCSSVWSPFTLKDKNELEKVSRIYTRIVFGRCLPQLAYHSYTERLAYLGMESLVVSRVKHDLILMYKLVNRIGERSSEFSKYFVWRQIRSRETQYNKNGFCFHVRKCNSARFTNNFYYRMSRIYPLLPKHIVHAGSLAKFKCSLSNFYLNFVLNV